MARVDHDAYLLETNAECIDAQLGKFRTGYLQGTLNHEDAVAFLDHLDACTACSVEVSNARVLSALGLAADMTAEEASALTGLDLVRVVAPPCADLLRPRR